MNKDVESMIAKIVVVKVIKKLLCPHEKLKRNQSLRDSENINYTSNQAKASLDTANLNSWEK